MKTLVSSVIWCPENQPKRLKTIIKHLEAFKEYKGEYDLLVIDNGSTGEVLETVKRICSELKNCTLEHYEENKGWAWARNRGIKICMENDYDIIILMDCDIWVEKLDWIERVQNTVDVLPAFMCRMKEDKCMTGGRAGFGGKIFEIYDEWLGCINVFTRDVIKLVGGYNFTELPRLWGFNDCFFGRQLLKAGVFGNCPHYPSLANLDVIEEHCKEYDSMMDSTKNSIGASYSQEFWRLHNEVMSGKRSFYYDYNIEQ